MFAILASAFNVALGWVFRVVVLKGMVFGLFLLITTELTSYMVSKLAGTSVGGLGSAFGSLSSGVLWLMHVCRMETGLPMILAATVTAFAIRRLPFVG